MPKDPGFAIASVEEVAYWFRQPKVDLAAADEGLGFSFENSIKANQTTNTVDVTATIEIRRVKVDPESRKPPLLHYEVRFQFTVDGLDYTPHPDEEPGYEYIQLPSGLAPALAGTAYSTCRGMLFVRTAGSQFHTYLLPITNSAALVDKMNDRLRKKIAAQPASGVDASEQSAAQNEEIAASS